MRFCYPNHMMDAEAKNISINKIETEKNGNLELPVYKTQIINLKLNHFIERKIDY